jgi:predicted phosphodiesterase
MNKKEIISFLEERPGYLKKNPLILQERLESICGENVSITDCVDAIRTVRYNCDNKIETTESTVKDLDLSNFTVKKVWGKEGNWNMSLELESDEDIGAYIEEIKNTITKKIGLRNKHSRPEHSDVRNPLVVVTDLHIGAYVTGLIKTKDYDINVVLKCLEEIADLVNSENYESVDIAILGDIIESFTGLNHINSWKSMIPTMHGATALISAYEILNYFLSKIRNLNNVYIIAGNHDRTTSNNKEDEDGDVAKIIAYFLNQKYANVQFTSLVKNIVKDNTSYILSHGHHDMIRKNPEYLILNYGQPQLYNVILSGHLHTRKGSISTNRDFILSDSVNHRAIVCPSIFTGNAYSERLGYTSTGGFLIFETRHGKLKMTDYTL